MPHSCVDVLACLGADFVPWKTVPSKQNTHFNDAALIKILFGQTLDVLSRNPLLLAELAVTEQQFQLTNCISGHYCVLGQTVARIGFVANEDDGKRSKWVCFNAKRTGQKFRECQHKKQMKPGTASKLLSSSASNQIQTKSALHTADLRELSVVRFSVESIDDLQHRNRNRQHAKQQRRAQSSFKTSAQTKAKIQPKVTQQSRTQSDSQLSRVHEQS